MEKNYTKIMHERRRSLGLCCKCGNPNDREGFYCSTCLAEHNAKLREYEDWYLENGICPRCHKENLYGKEKICILCAAKNYTYKCNIKKTPEQKIQNNERRREMHKKAIENGICTRCRKRKANNGLKTCSICRNKENEKRRERELLKKGEGHIPRKERFEKGICYNCLEPVKPGYKVCEKHYQINVKNANCEKSKEAREVNKKKYYLKYGGL